MSASSPRLLVVGSLNADLVVYTDRLPGPGETLRGSSFVISPGGKSANQAVAAARLGARVSLVGAVGADGNGDLLIKSVSDSGVDVSGVRRSEADPTGVALITVDASAENSIVIVPGANGTLTSDDVNGASFDEVGVVCLCLEVSTDTVLAAARAGHAAGATVVLNLSPFGAVPDELVELTDVLLVNAHEGAQLLDQSGGPEGVLPRESSAVDAWREVAARFHDRGLARVVVTLGSSGSVVLDATQEGDGMVTPVAATRVTPVDTTGAGDCFTGALAARLAAGDDLSAAAAFASVAAALATTGKGTQAAYPTYDQVLGRLETPPAAG
jgi:ribokinase